MLPKFAHVCAAVTAAPYVAAATMATQASSTNFAVGQAQWSMAGSGGGTPPPQNYVMLSSQNPPNWVNLNDAKNNWSDFNPSKDGIQLSEFTVSAESKKVIRDIGIATGSIMIHEGIKRINKITNSRSGITHGKVDPNSAKVYNKARYGKVGSALKTGGVLINIYVVTDAIDDKSLSDNQRDYVISLTIPSALFPITGIPIAIGDFVGTKYASEITYQVEEGELHQFMKAFFEMMGVQTEAPKE